MIFVASFLAKPGQSAMDQRAAEPIDPTAPAASSEWIDLGDGLWSVGPNTARETFMHDASDDVAAWALPQIRPQFYGVMAEITPLTEWPAVAATTRCGHRDQPGWAGEPAERSAPRPRSTVFADASESFAAPSMASSEVSVQRTPTRAEAAARRTLLQPRPDGRTRDRSR